MSGAVSSNVAEVSFTGHATRDALRSTPIETPIAFEFAGIAYAVMLASPIDLEDFAVGFALSEGLITSADQLADLNLAQVDGGYIIRANLPPEATEVVHDRLRLKLGEGSCGLCGIQSIEEVLRPLRAAPRPVRLGLGSLHKAVEILSEHQPLSRQTGATHAAAFCSAAGDVVAVREDVGRHNALDKLIGHCARSGIAMDTGFVLLTARCSYELVEKTVRAGCGLLATISAPTSLALERAEQSGLTLVVLARSDTALVANDPYGIFT